MFKDLKIVDFIDQLNSSAPTPGGGGVAALNGAEACGLTMMVCNVTVNKQLTKGLEPDKELVKTALVASALQNQLFALMDDDADVFGQLMQCYKLPKDTEEQKETRRQAILDGCKNACNPPKKTVKSCLQLLDLVKTAVTRGDKGVISDGYLAGRLAISALWGGIYNLRINAASIKDKAFADDLYAIVADTEKQIAVFTAEVLDKCPL